MWSKVLIDSENLLSWIWLKKSLLWKMRAIKCIYGAHCMMCQYINALTFYYKIFHTIVLILVIVVWNIVSNVLPFTNSYPSPSLIFFLLLTHFPVSSNNYLLCYLHEASFPRLHTLMGSCGIYLSVCGHFMKSPPDLLIVP